LLKNGTFFQFVIDFDTVNVYNQKAYIFGSAYKKDVVVTT